MKKFYSFLLVGAALLAALSLAGPAPATPPQADAAVVADLSYVDLESVPLFAVEPDAPLAVLALIGSILATLALAGCVRGAWRRPWMIPLLAVAIAANAIRRFVAFAVPKELRAHSLFTWQLAANEWTRIADLWVPEILAEGMQENIIERTAFLDSGVVATSAELTAIASGPGTEVTIPFLIEPNHDDQLQTQDTAPELRRMTSGTQKAAVFNRVSTLGMHALAGVVSGVRPGGDLLSVLIRNIQGLRKRQRNRLVIAQISGLFDVATTPDANSGALKALRKDAFSETGAAPAAGLLIDSTKMLQACALLGENKELLTGGAILMHSVIEAALVDQDQIDVVRNSEGAIVLRQWKGMQVFISDKLVRNGGVSGKVYYTFFCGRGSIAMGDKPQTVTDLAGDVAALQLDLRDIAKNNVAIYDRTRFILHPQGAKWTPGGGVPANTDAGPSNAEVADDANWTLGANDVKNTRIVCLRTNG